MTLQTKRVSLREPHHVPDPALVTVGSLIPDVHIIPTGPRSGNKQTARFVTTLGGSAANCGRFGPANGFSTAVIAAQQAGWVSGFCREAARPLGLRLLLQERTAIAPGCPSSRPTATPISATSSPTAWAR